MDESKIVAAILTVAIILRHKPVEENVPLDIDFACHTYDSCLKALGTRAQTEPNLPNG